MEREGGRHNQVRESLTEGVLDTTLLGHIVMLGRRDDIQRRSSRPSVTEHGG